MRTTNKQKTIDFLDDQLGRDTARYAAFIADLKALAAAMRAADKPTLAVAMADKEWAERLDAVIARYQQP